MNNINKDNDITYADVFNKGYSWKKRNGKEVKNNGIITPESVQDLLEKYKSAEQLEKEKNERDLKKEEKINALYQEWLKYDHVSEYQNIYPSSDTEVIVRLFYYNFKDVFETGVILNDEYKVTCIGKVVSVSKNKSYSLNLGDIIRVPSTISVNVINQDWVKWKQDILSQPSLAQEMPEPTMYVGVINKWSDNIVTKNPFGKISIDDQHTFCLRYSQIQLVEKND